MAESSRKYECYICGAHAPYWCITRPKFDDTDLIDGRPNIVGAEHIHLCAKHAALDYIELLRLIPSSSPDDS